MGKKTVKQPIANQKIFEIMMKTTFIVGGVFLLKNLIGQTWMGAVAVGICLIIFAGAMVAMRNLNVDQYKKQFALCIALPLLVFFISIFSGNYYSDDFPLFLAVVGLSSIYLEPSYTKAQMIEIPILLALLYVINPGKADPMGQYIMCVALFVVAAYTFYLVNVRGRAFTEISREKAKEAERLLTSIKHVGEELQANYETSSDRIDGMREVNTRLEENAEELKNGSSEIREESQEIETACDTVQEYVQVTEVQIDALNKEVQQVEQAMSENKKNIQLMDDQMQSVKSTISATGDVFTQLQQQIEQISEATKQLTSIAANTKMLALNASIEAARAGESGAGFAVVATQVQSLALDSNNCSNQVIMVVESMEDQIAVTTEQLQESVDAINNSQEFLVNLESGFEELINSFDSLYKNIEEQNRNVKNVDSIFGNLRDKVNEMNLHSEENRNTVDTIVGAMDTYKEHMNKIIGDARTIHQLSSSMLRLSKKDKK